MHLSSYQLALFNFYFLRRYFCITGLSQAHADTARHSKGDQIPHFGGAQTSCTYSSRSYPYLRPTLSLLGFNVRRLLQ